MLAARDPAAGQAAPAPHNPIKTWHVCMLPEHEAEARKEEEEDEIAGVDDPNYECKMCQVAYVDEDEDIAYYLRNVFVIFRKMKDYPVSVRFEKMARKWNETLYEMDRRVGGRKNIPKLTRADVRYHMRKHYTPTDVEKIDGIQSWVYANMQAAQYEGIWQRLHIDGTRQETIEISNHATAAWCKLNNQFVKLGKLKSNIMNQEIKSKNPQTGNTGAFIANRIRKETML